MLAMKIVSLAASAALALALPTAAQEADPAPSPGEIVAQAGADEWVAIAPEDLLVMRLASDREGNTRQVVIQLMPAPFGQGWIDNIRTLARAGYWDDSRILRVQDNYVVQWGQPDPEMGVEEKPVPNGLKVMAESDYVVDGMIQTYIDFLIARGEHREGEEWVFEPQTRGADPYADRVGLYQGWPIATRYLENGAQSWPVHCYGMVGVGRGMSPSTGDGSQLYTVIGHAPRHLDRNIAVVGRIVEGMEHLSSLPRGTGPLGFYEEASQRVPILSVSMASELPQKQRPRFEYLSTESDSFSRYAAARANRRDPFFIAPAGGADICNIPVPVRRAGE